MKVMISHKCIMHDGRKKTINHEYDRPEFSESKCEFDLHGQRIHFTNTVEDQIMEFIDGIDKSQWMYDNEVLIILDYYIKKKRKRKISFKQYVAKYLDNSSEDFVFAFMHTYQIMKSKLKGLSNKKKLQMILSTMDVAMIAQSKAYNDTISWLKGDSKTMKQKLSNNGIERNLETKNA